MDITSFITDDLQVDYYYRYITFFNFTKFVIVVIVSLLVFCFILLSDY